MQIYCILPNFERNDTFFTSHFSYDEILYVRAIFVSLSLNNNYHRNETIPY